MSRDRDFIDGMINPTYKEVLDKERAKLLPLDPLTKLAEADKEIERLKEAVVRYEKCISDANFQIACADKWEIGLCEREVIFIRDKFFKLFDTAMNDVNQLKEATD